MYFIYIHNPVLRGAALVGQEDAQKAEEGVAVAVKDAALGEHEDSEKVVGGPVGDCCYKD